MPFIWPWKKILCPFCFEYFRPGQAPTRNISNAQSVADDVVRRFLGLPAEDKVFMHPVEEVPSDFFSRLLSAFYFPKLCDRQGEIRRRICPHCHMQLPTQMGNSGKRSDIIAVTGYRVSGKSNFFGVLIDSLKKRYSKEIGMNLMTQETFSVTKLSSVFSDELYADRYGQYLYQSSAAPTAVPATRSARHNLDIRIPLIYRLNLTRFSLWQRLRHPFASHRAIDLVLFDAAGEDMDNPETMALFGRYVSRAAGVITLIDPLSYDEIRRDLQTDIAPESYSSQSFDTLATIINCIENYSPNYRAQKKIQTPLAVVLSKFDELRGLPDLPESVFRDHVHASGFDKTAADDVSEKLRNFLNRRSLDYLTSEVENNFANCQYFGMAALGRSPEKDQTLSSIEPINVVDPILWLLYKLGYLQTKQEMKP